MNCVIVLNLFNGNVFDQQYIKFDKNLFIGRGRFDNFKTNVRTFSPVLCGFYTNVNLFLKDNVRNISEKLIDKLLFPFSAIVSRAKDACNSIDRVVRFSN